MEENNFLPSQYLAIGLLEFCIKKSFEKGKEYTLRTELFSKERKGFDTVYRIESLMKNLWNKGPSFRIVSIVVLDTKRTEFFKPKEIQISFRDSLLPFFEWKSGETRDPFKKEEDNLELFSLLEEISIISNLLPVQYQLE